MLRIMGGFVVVLIFIAINILCAGIFYGVFKLALWISSEFARIEIVEYLLGLGAIVTGIAIVLWLMTRAERLIARTPGKHRGRDPV